MALPSHVFAAPYGGQVVSGAAAIAQSGTVTNINQSTNKAIINWQGFSIASNETVNFNQPNVYSMTLNRVIGNEKSIIAGALNATGKVYLINANGILFSQGSSVNTAGLVASTLDITNEDFLKGNYVFQGNGQLGEVINMGVIKATGNGAGGGYVALLGDQVKNEGIIIAERGTVSLNGAQKVTLNFNGDSLVNVSLDEGSLNALVENKKAILADGGKVILTAKAASDLVASQVNVSGIVQARTLADLTGGSIEVNAHGGTTSVSGTLDASAPNGGNGGSIETSGKSVKIADTATITTAAAKGKTGTWTIDPDGFTIAAYGGDMTGATLGRQLARNNVTIFSTQGRGTDGDINVNDTVTWAAATLLTLNATNAITVNGSLAPTGTGGGVVLLAGTNITINTPLSLGANSFAATAGGTITLAAPLSWTGNQTVALTAAEDLKLYSTITGEGGTLNLTATSGSVDLDGATSLGATTVNVAAGTDVNLNAAFTWTGDTIATLTAGNNININAPLTATGTNAGLVMNYGNDYTIWTKASYSGAVLNSDGIPVAQTAPDNAVYGSVTLSGTNATLTMNGQKYTLIHNMSDFNSVQAFFNDSKLTGTCAGSTGTCYWNPSTQAYDISQTVASEKGSYWWNTTTQAYDIPDQDSATGKYYRVTTGGYTGSSSMLPRASSYVYYYDVATASYDSRFVYTGTGYFYNAETGLYDLHGGTYALAQNLDASGTTYADSLVTVFSGTFAGLGHTVDNLSISTSANYIGLIGQAFGATTLRDIGVTNADISTTGSNVGVLIGSSTGGLTISNAYATGKVTGTSLVGGLLGYVSGTLSKFSLINSSYTDVDSTATDGYSAGLIASGTYITINNSNSLGDVAAKSGAAGLIYSSSSTNVGNSYASGDVVTSGNEAGGLIGKWSTGENITNYVVGSFATGNVTGGYTVGGLIGSINGSGTVIVNNCYHATGTVTSKAPYSSAVDGVGGLIGFIDNSGTITVSNVHASGDVIVIGDYVVNVGGLIGSAGGQSTPKAINVVNSYSTSNVTATGAAYVGGLIGYAYYTFITGSYSTGNINGSSVRSPGTSGSVASTGGLVGIFNNGGIDTSYASGNVSGYQSGGIAGAAAFSTDNNNYYNANSSSSAYGGSFGITGTGSSGLTTSQMESQGMKTSGNFDPSAPSSVIGTSPGQAAVTTAADATNAAAANASSVISNIQSQAVAAAYVARQEAISQVTEVADGQQLSVSQSAPTTKEVVTPETTKEISLAEAIRNFTDESGVAGNASGRGASYSAGIKTVTADGVTYIVDDGNAGSDENKDKKNAKKGE